MWRENQLRTQRIWRPGRALTQTHKAHVARHMGGIRGRKGRKKDRIYERVRRGVCLNAMLTALPLPTLSLALVYCERGSLSPDRVSSVNRLLYIRV